MAKPSGIKLCPLDEGEAVDIPSAKTTIGRGSFLQVADKRVSRNHATLEVNDDGKLVVVPIHTNPCFFKAHGNGQQVILPKDKPRILDHGDVLSLLPDKLFFQVVYSNQKNMDEEGDEIKQDRLKSAGSVDDDNQEEKPFTIIGEGKEMALPVKKKRILPGWMKGAARRSGLGQSSTKTTHGARQEASRTQVLKTPNKARTAQPVSKPKPSRRAKKSESDEDDWDEEKTPVKKSSRKRTSKRGRYRDDDDDDDDDEEILPRRRPRAASLKKPKYTDDDFVISDEELDLEHMSSEAESGPGGRRGKDADSDFVLDEEDSGSDWESSSRKPKTKVKGGRTVSHKGRGSVRGKRKRGHDSDSFSDEDSDGYVPRPSKRRAAVAATSRMKASKVSDEDDDDDNDDDDDKSNEDNRKPANKKAKLSANEVHQKKSKRGLIDDDEEDDDFSAIRKKAGTGKQKDESNDEDVEVDKTDSKKTGKKKPCHYGKACYRKNPKHFEEFSHAQNNRGGEGDSSGSEGKKGREVVVRQKRAAALKQQEKLAALHENSDDDEDEDDSRGPKEENLQQQHSAPDEDSLNGDDNVSADSDSDFDPDDEESPSRSKAAKRAPQNKQKQKASV